LIDFYSPPSPSDCLLRSFNWYANSGATDHVTGKLGKLAIQDTYNGNDQMYTTNGTGMCIKHVGQSIIHTPHRNLLLNNVLHIPQVSKNLAFVHRIGSNNNVFFELHPNFFKDRESRKTLLHGKARGGLYPLPSSSLHSSSKHVLSSNKCSTTRRSLRFKSIGVVSAKGFILL
jgi:hypothetical protein